MFKVSSHRSPPGSGVPVDGKIEGTIQTTGRVVIGKDGFVSGTIDCTNADIEGSFSGKLIFVVNVFYWKLK